MRLSVVYCIGDNRKRRLRLAAFQRTDLVHNHA